MDIKVEISPKEITAKVETPNEPIYGGTKDYTKLDNLPSINGSVIIGDMTLLQLGIQPKGDYAERSELPVNVSDLYNDAGYLVQSDLSDYAKTENIPTKVSQLENDSDYATTMQIPTKTSQLSNDSEFAYTKDIPTKVSQLENDSDYAAKSDLPTKTSQLSNDSNLAYVSDIPTKFSELENDSLKNVDNTSDENKPVSIAQRKAIDDAYANSNAYTDQKIADLIGGAPETLDTLKEVADAIAESKDVEEALNSAIGTKANQTELDTHTGNDTIHITSTERENWNDANDKKHTHSNKSILDKITQTLLDNWNAAYTHISDTVKHITSDERTAWNNKYAKPSGGIPKTDLASAVQTSLGKADTALQAHQDISGLATKTELENHATANAVAFDAINNNLNQLEYSEVAGGKNLTETNYTSRTRLIGVDVSHLEIGKTYTISCICKSTDTKYPTCTLYYGDTASKNLGRGFRDYYTFTHTGKGISIYACSNWTDSDGKTITCEDIQIEEGTTATDYEPYIPSVKMLAEKTTQIDDNNMLGWVVPEEMPIKNYVDSNGVFHQRVGRVDLGSLNWTKNSADYSLFYSSLDDFKKSLDYTNMVYCKKYYTSSSQSTAVNKNITGFVDADNVYPTQNWIYIKDETYTSDASGLKESLKGIYAYYELATEITTNVDGNEAVTKVKNDLVSLKNLFSSNITGIKLNGTTLEVSFNNGTSKGKVTFDGIAEEETIIS